MVAVFAISFFLFSPLLILFLSSLTHSFLYTISILILSTSYGYSIFPLLKIFQASSAHSKLTVRTILSMTLLEMAGGKTTLKVPICASLSPLSTEFLLQVPNEVFLPRSINQKMTMKVKNKNKNKKKNKKKNKNKIEKIKNKKIKK